MSFEDLSVEDAKELSNLRAAQLRRDALKEAAASQRRNSLALDEALTGK